MTVNASSPVGYFSAEPMRRRVSLIIHNPVIDSRRGLPLSKAFGWQDPDRLPQELIADLKHCSFGVADYTVVERIEVNDFPVKQDGFRYSPQAYAKCWRAGRGFHHPDAVDYYRLLAEFGMIQKVNTGQVDEFWLMGFPYAGYYESRMAGPGAFWCNAPPLEGTDSCARRFVIMGFNYERGVGEMLENFGHRAESIMTAVFAGVQGEANLWERFTRYDLTHPGRAEVGNVHFAPNSVRDYDWGNPRYVASNCDDWLNFPDFQGVSRPVNCQDWGNGDIRAHHLWWFRHFPHVPGETYGISHNWWSYVVDPNRVP